MGLLHALVLGGFMLLYVFFFYYSDIFFFSSTLYSQSVLSEAIGLILAMVGLAFTLWARFALGTNWSRDPSVVRSDKLITTGPYKLARHPIYSGVVAMFLGTAIYFGLLGGFIGFAVGAIMVFLKTIIEEKELMKQFPKDYPEHKKHTRAFIPLIY
jgi:protein-S-isoprenylcysteine O-methyltransferase Ste14